jgi:hypothetical protein
MVVARDDLVFDWAGFQRRDGFLLEYFEAMRRVFPDWDARFELIELDPIGWDFCRLHKHRHPSQFLHDPLPRARAFVNGFQPAGARK